MISSVNCFYLFNRINVFFLLQLCNAEGRAQEAGECQCGRVQASSGNCAAELCMGKCLQLRNECYGRCEGPMDEVEEGCYCHCPSGLL